MDRRKELILQYKEMDKEAGVYQIRNTRNQKILVAATPDLKTINGKRFQLEMGSHMNKELQREWDEFGPDVFAFEVLEVLEEKKEGYFNKKEELKKLEAKWLERLEPYDEQGYNKRPIRRKK
ncbi:MAG: GIY-YIG nuclease family protein [Limnochordia bacterium]